MKLKRIIPLLLLILLVAFLINLQNRNPGDQQHLPAAQVSTQASIHATSPPPAQQPEASLPGKEQLSEDGIYDSAKEVAFYIHTYQRLPGNYITKAEARALGWEGGDLRPYAKGRSIGGDRFGNYEGLLPTKKGRVYYECDIDALDKPSRGAKRLVYSNDGLIYYTDDHYKSFTLLYGEE